MRSAAYALFKAPRAADSSKSGVDIDYAVVNSFPRVRS